MQRYYIDSKDKTFDTKLNKFYFKLDLLKKLPPDNDDYHLIDDEVQKILVELKHLSGIHP